MIKQESTTALNSYNNCLDDLIKLANKIKSGIISILITPVKDKFIGTIIYEGNK